MFYTRAGHIPHLTWDLFECHISSYVEHGQRLLIQVSLQNIFDSLEVISASGGLRKFYRFKAEHFLHLSLLDQLSPRDVVTNLHIHFWSRGGRKKIDMDKFKYAIEMSAPDSFQTPFDFDTPIGCCNKKLQKCLRRSRSFLEDLKRNSEQKDDCFDKRAIFSIGGGSSIFHRKAFINELLLPLFPDNIKAICLDLFLWSKSGGNAEKFDEEFLNQLITETLSCLPSDKLRVVEGPFDPEQVLFLCKQGIDLFDSSYPTMLAEKGFAFGLIDGFPLDGNSRTEQFTLIDLNEKRFFFRFFLTSRHFLGI
jgi:queuine/archaeosine tRNA-ribosyltransferase